MATQTGLVLPKVGGPFETADNIPRPTPGPKEVLVKSLLVGINPVEGFILGTGLLVTEWPAVLGSDFCGRVLQAGDGCTKLKEGDTVYGLCRVGQNKYSPFQETFLVDEEYAFKKPDTLSAESATTCGGGVLTAAFGINVAGPVPLPAPGSGVEKRDDWVVILGGSGSVGSFAVQIAGLCGYKILASCSPSKAAGVLELGADATFNNRASVQDQVAEIKSVTNGNYGLVFDATAMGHEVALKALEISTQENKFYSTVDDWSEWELKTPSAVKEYRIESGHLGRDDEIGPEVSAHTARMVPYLEGYLDSGLIKPVDYEMYDGVGWEKLKESMEFYSAGKAKKKLNVRVQED